MKVLCKGCEGKGYIDPPYADSTAPVVTCPCCEGSGMQVVEVTEIPEARANSEELLEIADQG